jgi:tetrahydromethanopterin S-methyltransferase subunit G
MADVTNELMYELMKAMNDRLNKVDQRGDEIKAELQAIRGHMLATSQDVANIYSILGEHGRRLERIERRLELVEA